MALEQIKAQIALLLEEMVNQPEDQHEVHEQLREKLNELRAMGMPLPADLVALEKRLEERFRKARLDGRGASFRSPPPYLTRLTESDGRARVDDIPRSKRRLWRYLLLTSYAVVLFASGALDCPGRSRHRLCQRKARSQRLAHRLSG